MLNPDLFNAVCRRIGPAKVLNENQELVGFYFDDIVRGCRGLKILKRGETIQADCPFCNDHRGRLSINHRYGIPDRETGNRGTHLWKCYNEECQNKPEERAKLRDRLLPEIDLPRGGPVLPPAQIVQTSPTGLEPVEFPGLMLPVDSLSPDHKARTYLESRGFDVGELSRVWEVGYAETMPARTAGAMSQDRIIIPVRQKGVMVGWQSRFIGDIDWKATGIPKYLTYFSKSQAIYGYDQAVGADVVVLVEGASDVWRYGPGAVCGFGKKLSPDQVRLVIDLAGWPHKPIVLIPDANDKDAFDNFCSNMGDILAAGFRGHYGLVPLPRGKDPGSMSRTMLRSMTRYVVDSLANNDTHKT